MRRAIIACGGTGGHMSPGIALADELVSRGWNCKLLISKKQVDSRLVQKYPNLNYASISGCGLNLSPLGIVKFAYNLLKGTLACFKVMREERPDFVIGFGGFLSTPALLAGRFLGLPVAIHESNRAPGRVTRLLGMLSHRIYLPSGVQIRTAHSSRIRYVGMPVRREIYPISKQRAREILGLDPSLKTLLVFGGSQGAKSLNDWTMRNLESLAQQEIQVFCLTGAQGKIDSDFSFRSKRGKVVRSIFKRFSDEMALVLSAADLVVSRAGAGSISEIARCRVPAIVIPYPYAADNHQELNGLFFERQGGGMMIKEAYLGDLLNEVNDTIYNDWLLQRFRTNLDMMARLVPQEFMANDLESYLSDQESNHQMNGRLNERVADSQ